MSLVIIGQQANLTTGTESFVSSIKDLWFALSASKEEKEKRWDEEAARTGTPKMPKPEEFLRENEKQYRAMVSAIEDTFTNPRWIKSRTARTTKMKVPAGLVVNGKLLPIEELIKQTNQFSGFHGWYLGILQEDLEGLIVKCVDAEMSTADTIQSVTDDLSKKLKGFNSFKLGNTTYDSDFKATTAESEVIEIDPIPLSEFETYGKAILRILDEIFATHLDQFALEHSVDYSVHEVTYESDFDEDRLQSVLEREFSDPAVKFMETCIKQILEMVSAYWRLLEASVEDKTSGTEGFFSRLFSKSRPNPEKYQMDGFVWPDWDKSLDETYGDSGWLSKQDSVTKDSISGSGIVAILTDPSTGKMYSLDQLVAECNKAVVALEQSPIAGVVDVVTQGAERLERYVTAVVDTGEDDQSSSIYKALSTYRDWEGSLKLLNLVTVEKKADEMDVDVRDVPTEKQVTQIEPLTKSDIPKAFKAMKEIFKLSENTFSASYIAQYAMIDLDEKVTTKPPKGTLAGFLSHTHTEKIGLTVPIFYGMALFKVCHAIELWMHRSLK